MSIHATVVGHLGRDPETRTTGNGNTVCNFSVASSHGYGDRKTTTWVRVAAWGKLGETCQRFLSKGRQVVAVGELYTREHDGKTYVEMDARAVDFVGGREEQPTPKPQRRQAAPTVDDSDIPF